MKLKNHYTHKPKEYQILSYNEIKSGLNSHVDFISLQGDVKHAKVTSTKTWKKKSDIAIGLKYGLYEYNTTVIFPDNTYLGVQLVKEIN